MLALPLRLRFKYAAMAPASRSRTRFAMGDNTDAGLDEAARAVIEEDETDAFAEYGELNDNDPFDDEFEGIDGSRDDDADDERGEEANPRSHNRRPSTSLMSEVVVRLPPEPLRNLPSENA